MVVPVHGLPQNQAREALAISGELTDAELFALMACLHLGKSASEGVFSRRSLLNRPSVVMPLRDARIDLSDVIDSLVRKGFVDPAGFGRVRLSDKGRVIEHRFSILRDHLVLRGRMPGVGTRLANVPELRARMKDVSDSGGLSA